MIQNSSALTPIEIKSSATFRPEFIKPIEKFRQLTHRTILNSYLIYAGEAQQRVRDVNIIHYEEAARVFEG